MTQSQQPSRPVEFVKITVSHTSNGYPAPDRVLRMVPEQAGPLYILKDDGTRVLEEPPVERAGVHGYESTIVEGEDGNIAQMVEVPPSGSFYAAATGLTVTYKAIVYADTSCSSVLKVQGARAVSEDVDLFILLGYPDAQPGVLPPDGNGLTEDEVRELIGTSLIGAGGTTVDYDTETKLTTITSSGDGTGIDDSYPKSESLRLLDLRTSQPSNTVTLSATEHTQVINRTGTTLTITRTNGGTTTLANGKYKTYIPA